MHKKLTDKMGVFVAVPVSFVEGSAKLSVHAKWLFVVLRYYTNNTSGDSFPAYSTLKKVSGLHLRTISKCLSELEALGWLTKHKRFGKSTIYTLQFPTIATDANTEQSVKNLPSRSPSTDAINSIGTRASVSIGTDAKVTRSKEPRLKEQDRNNCADAQDDYFDLQAQIRKDLGYHGPVDPVDDLDASLGTF